MHRFVSRARAALAAGLAVLVAGVLAAAAPAAVAKPVPAMGTWTSTLQPRDIDGDGQVDAFYDTTLNITWLARAKAPVGRLRWEAAMAYMATFRFKGLTGWRLPRFFDGAATCDYSEVGGTNCGYLPDPSTSEMAWMYYVTLGNAGAPTPGYGLVNTGPFRGLEAFLYWTETPYGPYPKESWSFQWLEGRQQRHMNTWTFDLWPVRDGDVPHVPLPPR